MLKILWHNNISNPMLLSPKHTLDVMCFRYQKILAKPSFESLHF